MKSQKIAKVQKTIRKVHLLDFLHIFLNFNRFFTNILKKIYIHKFSYEVFWALNII